MGRRIVIIISIPYIFSLLLYQLPCRVLGTTGVAVGNALASWDPQPLDGRARRKRGGAAREIGKGGAVQGS